MDFGKVAGSEIPIIDFTLPADGDSVEETLTLAYVDTQFYIGCSKWGRKDWRGLIFPSHLKEADFLDEYSAHFNCVEMNTTFYSTPSKLLISQWHDRVKQADFLFLPKMVRTVTHINRLQEVEQPLINFIDSVSELKEYLGPIFIQIGDNFSPKHIDTLITFIELLPADKQFYIELRHPDWFTDRYQAIELFKKYSIGWVITDTPGRRDVVHMEMPIPEVYIRFNGNGLENLQSDFNRVNEWVERLKAWTSKGLKTVYFIVHQEDERDTLTLADYVIKQFNKHLNAKIPELKFIE